jgi:polyphenol oxidase
VLLHHEALAGAGWAVTDRHGGVSTGDFASLNLAQHVGDDPAAVAENRRRVSAAVGRELVVASQVHGREVVEVTGPWEGSTPEADALLTRSREVAVGVLVADCTPVALLSPQAVGVAHAGREGMRKGVVPALVEALRDAGAEQLVARVGPGVCGRCYDVPLELREATAADVPASRSRDRHGRPSVDVASGVLEQLDGLVAEVRLVDGCAYEHPDLYSYRRDRTTGRFAALAWRA